MLNIVIGWSLIVASSALLLTVFVGESTRLGFSAACGRGSGVKAG
jgi:hypothetical protein